MPLELTCLVAFLSVLLTFAIALALIYLVTTILAFVAPLAGGGWVAYTVWNDPKLSVEDMALLTVSAGVAAAVTTADCLALRVGIRHFMK